MEEEIIEETSEEGPSFLKILFSFVLSITYIVLGYIIYYEYPSIAYIIKILGFVGFLISLSYVAIKLTTWSEKLERKIRDYFLLWLEIAYTLLIISIIAFTIRLFIIQPFLVKGESMEPNFKNGEYLIVNEISYKLGEKPKRGDVVVFKYPKDPRENYIKRIIGLSGEKIKIEDGKIFIFNQSDPDGVELKEYYIPYISQTDQNISQEWTLQNNDYFVIGDNRLPGGSSDSRTWGPLPRKNIIGRVWFVFWPPQEAKVISLPQYNF